MKELKTCISEGFFKNTGIYTPKSWFENVERKPCDNMFHGDRWNREYTCRVTSSGMLQFVDMDIQGPFKGEIDLNKGIVWKELASRYNPKDYIYKFEPESGHIDFFLINRNDKSAPVIHIIIQRWKTRLYPFELKITNRDLLGIDDKFYKSKGYHTGGHYTGEYIQNKELINKFIGSNE